MADRVKLTEAQEYLERLNRMIAKDEHETNERVTRCAGLDGDSDFVSREEWQAPLRPCRAAKGRAGRNY